MHRQMAFLSGPRQVRKTTAAKFLGEQFASNCNCDCDKQKREVDFVVTRDRQPWFLVEVKSSRKVDCPIPLFELCG